jgi:hypothetical protein
MLLDTLVRFDSVVAWRGGAVGSTESGDGRK